MIIAKVIIALVSVYGGVGGVLFDAVLPGTARQHQGNPAWPPHAKFHNGQTMMLGALNMLLTLAILFCLGPPTLSQTLFAAALAEAYFASMLLAPIFPGAAWSDPEFDDINLRPLGIPVQKFISLLATCLIIFAIIIAILQR